MPKTPRSSISLLFDYIDGIEFLSFSDPIWSYLPLFEEEPSKGYLALVVGMRPGLYSALHHTVRNNGLYIMCGKHFGLSSCFYNR